MKNSLLKKLLTFSLAALLVFSTAACGGEEEVAETSESESTSVSQAIIEDEGEIVSVSQVESEPESESEPEEEVPEVVALLRNMSPVWRDLQTGKREYIL